MKNLDKSHSSMSVASVDYKYFQEIMSQLLLRVGESAGRASEKYKIFAHSIRARLLAQTGFKLRLWA